MTVKENEEKIKKLKTDLMNYAKGLESINERIAILSNRLTGVVDLIKNNKEAIKKIDK